MILSCFTLQPPFFVLIVMCFVWGICGGSTMTLGRTVLQLVTPATHRGRIMSLFQFGLGGGIPIGAMIAGILAGWLGLKLALVLPAMAMAVLIAMVLICSHFWTTRVCPHSNLRARIQ